MLSKPITYMGHARILDETVAAKGQNSIGVVKRM